MSTRLRVHGKPSQLLPDIVGRGLRIRRRNEIHLRLPRHRLRSARNDDEGVSRVFPARCGTVCLVGVQGLANEVRLGNVVFRPYFDAERILPRCDCVICHGGHNTIVQSLVNGVPLVVFLGPIFERRFKARKVQEAGAGIYAELPEFRAGRLRDILASRERYADRAVDLGRRIVSLGGPDAALEAMKLHVARLKR